MDLLLARGLDPNFAGYDNRTPLDWARMTQRYGTAADAFPVVDPERVASVIRTLSLLTRRRPVPPDPHTFGQFGVYQLVSPPPLRRADRSLKPVPPLPPKPVTPRA